MTSPAPGRQGRLGDLAKRFASALVMVALALGTLFYDDRGQSFLLFWLFAAVLVHWEWQHMVGRERVLLRALAGTACLALLAALARLGDFDLPVLAFAGGLAVMAVCAPAGLRGWAMLGLAYAGALLLALCLLRFSNAPVYRQMAIVWLFAVVWGTDIMAYFGGRLIGGPKLWPRVSPSKTWSGTFTGIFCGAALGAGAVAQMKSHDFPQAEIGLLPVFLLGLLIASAAQAGDLMESAMKRHFGVKDSSQLIPGHGGFMDRLDGFIFACVVAALIGSLRYGPSFTVNGLFQW